MIEKINPYTIKSLEALARAYNIVDYFFWLYCLDKITQAEQEHWIQYADKLIEIHNYYRLLAEPSQDIKRTKVIFI
jgi:hypothetical protein